MVQPKPPLIHGSAADPQQTGPIPTPLPIHSKTADTQWINSNAWVIPSRTADTQQAGGSESNPQTHIPAFPVHPEREIKSTDFITALYFACFGRQTQASLTLTTKPFLSKSQTGNFSLPLNLWSPNLVSTLPVQSTRIRAPGARSAWDLSIP